MSKGAQERKSLCASPHAAPDLGTTCAMVGDQFCARLELGTGASWCTTGTTALRQLSGKLEGGTVGKCHNVSWCRAEKFVAWAKDRTIVAPNECLCTDKAASNK